MPATVSSSCDRDLTEGSSEVATWSDGEVTPGPKWDGSGALVPYVDVEWDAVLPVDARLPYEDLKARVDYHWMVRASGLQLPDDVAKAVNALWADHLKTKRRSPAKLRPRAKTSKIPIKGVEVPPGGSEPVPLETIRKGAYQTAPSTSTTAVKAEANLVAQFEKHLKGVGHMVHRLKIQPDGESPYLYTDIFDATDNILYEAKGVATREAVRMALGQLLDYRRYIQTAPALAVLLPHEPTNGPNRPSQNE
ncbi:MAG: hypothetical protein WAW17_30280 [Rhodococcus sp. (in: high G+C Gram-positive bacteria)]|uniref:hypothetical protein n=1 Tax=Rhodococcus sp. TaxID=1831 RepID=UPI003BB0F372